MTTADFEWHVIPDDANPGFVFVKERLAGTDLSNLYGPMRPQVSQTFIRARRDFVYRTVTSRGQATLIFNPRS